MPSIKRKIQSGLFYTAITKYSNVVVGIIISAILARLLTPAEFGIVAIVNVFLVFFNLLSNFGLGPAIIQEKDLTKEDVSSIFLFSIFFGFILASIFFLIAPFIATFYNDTNLINLSRIMAIAIFFESLKVVPMSLHQKKLRFKKIGIITLKVHIISGIIAVFLAYHGFSYYALVFNSILTGFLTFILLYLNEPIKIFFKFNIKPLKKISRFSSYQFLFNFINYFATNIDNLLVGKYFSNEALGFYSKSYQLMRLPVRNLTYVITPVLQPILAEYQEDKKIIYDTYEKIVKILAIIGFPLAILLHFGAYEIVNILYGPQWDQSIPVFKLLALIIGFNLILTTSGSIFQSLNRADLLFYAGIIGSTLTALGVLYGVFIGKTLIAIGLGLIIARIFNFFAAYYLLIKIALKHPLLNFLKILIFPILSSSIIALSLFVFSFVNFNNLMISLILKVIITLLLSYILLLFSKRDLALIKKYLKFK